MCELRRFDSTVTLSVARSAPAALRVAPLECCVLDSLLQKARGGYMSDNRPISELSVDRREETLVTNQPGYASTEQVSRDVAAERRLRFAQITRIIWTVLGVLEILLGLRFALKLIAANPDSGFAALMYGITGVFVAPFNALVGTPASGGVILELTTLIAMAIYALFFWVVVRVLRVAADRPSARTITRSVREQTPDGSISDAETERTTHTTSTG
jgi:YggT family protein